MDRSAYARKRRQAPGQPTTKPPVRLSREKKDAQKTRATYTSTESSTSVRRRDPDQRPSVDGDPNARSFTVGKVGRNGTLYLKPTRSATNSFTQPPATPPSTAGKKERERTDSSMMIEEVDSPAASGHVTPKVLTGNTFNPTLPVPRLSVASIPRTRSHSFSTIDETVKAQHIEATEIQLLLNGQEAASRPKSSLDLSEGLANFRIPHYRLGTPRFGDRGTAYLHNSVQSSLMGDVRSSVFSAAAFDRFPAPPGRDASMRFASYQTSAPLYLQPSQAASSAISSGASNHARTHKGDRIDLALYDHIEMNINDPSHVRYSVTTGQIMAATPGRLIAQITSPRFLDYELLSNFFLTYRNFLTSHDLLEYMLVRMEWALAQGSDAGRIVTVRTFVALRHWILNYFPDDFLPDYALRRKFSDRVNAIARALQQRCDGGGGDLNVIGELKKCWRRICAMFWAVDDVADVSADVDIMPGVDEEGPRVRASATSYMQSGQYDGFFDFRRSSILQLPAHIEQGEAEQGAETAFTSNTAHHAKTASIPATPMSEQSLTVLSCSVPFLRHLMPAKDPTPASRPNRLQKERPLSVRSTATVKKHKRSAHSLDALRNERIPSPSSLPEQVDMQSLPTTTFTGGLVRGLLLQPSPSNVDLLIPLSPPLDSQAMELGAARAITPITDRALQNPNLGVKKVVGDVRRALSHRNTPAHSNRSTNSSGSRSSGQSDRMDHPASWQQLSGPPRIDLLGEKVGDSYKEAFQEVADLEIAPPLSYNQREAPGMRLDLLQSPFTNRSHSHVTTGSRSIVIVDDTGMPDMPLMTGALPPLTPRSRAQAPKPLFGVSPDMPHDFDADAQARPFSGVSSTAVDSEGQYLHSPELPMHDLLAVPGIIGADGKKLLDSTQARKSSTAILDMPSIQKPLRRRPGGDLKEADNVHDLERSPGSETSDSYSTFSQAILSSGEPSVDFSNVHVVKHDDRGMEIPMSFLQGRTQESWTLLPTHSSQPNMRPSLKAKVSHLAKLPDDISDGGREDALAKLEGKAASPTASTYALATRDDRSDTPPGVHYAEPRRLQVMNSNSTGRNSPSLDEVQSPQTDRQGASIYRMSDDSRLASFPNAMLLENPGLGITNELPARSLHLQHAQVTDLSESAVAMHNANDNGRPVRGVRSPDSQGSFLLNDDESLSDISTEIADDQSSEDDNLAVRSFYFDDTVDDDRRHAAPFRPPPTPPSTDGATGSHMGDRSPAHLFGPVEPKTLRGGIGSPQPLRMNPPQEAELRRSLNVPSRKDTAHLPFVLAYESEVIAEQFTIIEKDALDEVEWKDLIGLNWQHSALQIHNWVDFLKRDDCNGVDIVVSRFNLVVKWVVSECVLTEAPSERARCITKYVHIAAHAHRLRNYATMYQIVLALRSSNISSLRKTWALVPPAEKELLARLEKLCQPRGNFHHLRVEMESASADDACIPFIGLYTHDLMFNAQKPARIDLSPSGGAALINFERYQTAAAIVKSLLTLIEASALYVFRPHPDVLSRCLWLAALPDAEIVARRENLE